MAFSSMIVSYYSILNYKFQTNLKAKTAQKVLFVKVNNSFEYLSENR